MVNASVFLFTVVCLVVISAITFVIEPSKPWFLIRMSIYRALEAICVFILLGVYTPPLSELLARRPRWRAYNSDATTSVMEKEEVELP